MASKEEIKQTADTALREIRELRSELARNGVATAINKLNAEVFNTTKKKVGIFWSHLYEELSSVPTLAGKVDAIIEYLGIDLSVSGKQVIKPNVVASKKKVTKKKGRR